MNVKGQLKQAGKQFIQGNLGYALRSIASKSFAENLSFSNLGFGGQTVFRMFGKDGSDKLFEFSGLNSVVDAYTKCSPLQAIINQKAQAFINGNTTIINSRGKLANSDKARKIMKLLLKPNPVQSGSHFEAQGKIFEQLFGYNVILAVNKPVGYGFEDAESLWNIPACFLQFEEEQGAYYKKNLTEGFKKITFTYQGFKQDLFEDEIFIIKDFTPSFNTLLLPESKVRSCQMAINNIIGCYETRNVLINNRGALGIMSSDKTDESGKQSLSPREKQDIQDELKKFGTKKDQFKFIVTNAAVKWQQIGQPTKDLMLFEEIRDDVQRLCEIFCFPYDLLPKDAGSTFNNIDAAEKRLYQNAILPESKSWYEQLNSMFKLEEAVETIVNDFSHVTALQEDKTKAASTRLILNQSKKLEYENGLIDLNNWLAAIGEEPIGELGNTRATDVRNTNVPLATIIGVGGVQSVLSVLTSTGMSEEARANTLQILFGISPTDAANMVIQNTPPASTNDNNNQSTNQQ